MKTLLAFSVLCILHVEAVVRVLTFHYNLPYLLELQCLSLDKFMVEDFELIVFNDAQDPGVEAQIEALCNQYGALCVRFQPEWHDWSYYLNDYIRCAYGNNPEEARQADLASPSLRHSRMIQYALENYGYSHNDIVVILDGDAFPIRTLSLNKMLEEREIVGSIRAGRSCSYFFYPVFVAFDPRKLKVPSDFQLHWDIMNGLSEDTGACSYYYMQDHPEVRIGKVPFLRGDVLRHWTQDDFERAGIEEREKALVEKFKEFYYEIHMDWHIFHFKGSSHTNGIRSLRKQYVSEFLDEILDQPTPPLQEVRVDPNPSEAPCPGDDI